MTTTRTAAPVVVRLPADRPDLGGKGEGLNRLMAAGLPVPPTAVVTAAAYRDVAADPRVRELTEAARAGSTVADTADEVFLNAPLDCAVEAEIVAAARAVGAGGRLAVRSSAGAEDTADFSFAGQYRSVLDVPADDPGAVLRAVRLVWASLWHPAPCAYRRAWGVSEEQAVMSVVLMRMVPAVLSGVVFTRDPGGETGRMRAETVTGLAEGLVSGTRTPEVWSLPREPDTVLPSPRGELAALALAAERLFGRPQDIEWAWDGQRVWLVQSRAITTVPGDGCDTPQDDAELMSTGVDEMLPGVLPPLLWEINAFLVEEALRAVFDEVGANPAHRDGAHELLRRVRGRAALDLSLLKEVAAAIPGASERDLEREYFGHQAHDDGPPARRRRSPLQDLRVFASRRRALIEAATVLVAVDDLAGPGLELGDLDDRALLAYRLRLLDLGARAMSAEFAAAASAVAAYRQLEVILTRYLGEAEAAGAAQLLTAGAGMAAPKSPWSSMAVFAGPTWDEQATTPPDRVPRAAERRRSRAGIEERLRRNPRWRRMRILTGQVVDVRLHLLRRVADEATEGLTRRERVKAAVLAVGGLVRRAHLELGRRLCERGWLADPADVDLLTETELRAALAGSGPPSGTLAVRRRWLERYRDDGPCPCGSPESRPSLRRRSPGARPCAAGRPASAGPPAGPGR
ncbi:PEP/pyruvate-binding domain-containing protein [Planobispora siamensis]|uniref:Pyruvate phosphate dikinase AMP/ATP-binding domain-containing protein n=1 Tax=Planobispora siamensis TaxID=936338 RepID=A0A8J3SKX7_9ACTN|nr:PEP/pyruvate-binding domain-containing protein [Planobispora siamensis]GIH96326.1 hypothetical protein Psi01_69560 [Planobispora siamensis]